MVGVVEITGAISGLKAALDLLKGINAGANAVALNEVKIALQGAILEAQSSLLAAQEAEAAHLRQIDDLKQEIVRLKDWSAERERYHLVDVWRGAMVYMPKSGMEDGKPAHWLCPNCFEQGQKSFLQFRASSSRKAPTVATPAKLQSRSAFGRSPFIPPRRTPPKKACGLGVLLRLVRCSKQHF